MKSLVCCFMFYHILLGFSTSTSLGFISELDRCQWHATQASRQP